MAESSDAPPSSEPDRARRLLHLLVTHERWPEVPDEVAEQVGRMLDDTTCRGDQVMDALTDLAYAHPVLRRIFDDTLEAGRQNLGLPNPGTQGPNAVIWRCPADGCPKTEPGDNYGPFLDGVCPEHSMALVPVTS
ncbi:MAG TPA: hypothetical protein VFC19_05695 [Candidatus Limnocylindrales bacterium]|nr:hypothetical protein [Candidatus Limnocylindrales bacterium]